MICVTVYLDAVCVMMFVQRLNEIGPPVGEERGYVCNKNIIFIINILYCIFISTFPKLSIPVEKIINKHFNHFSA